jgi:hypothetical protein
MTFNLRCYKPYAGNNACHVGRSIGGSDYCFTICCRCNWHAGRKNAYHNVRSTMIAVNQVFFRARVYESHFLGLGALGVSCRCEYPASISHHAKSQDIRPLAKKIYVIIKGFKFNALELTHNCKLLTTNYNASA